MRNLTIHTRIRSGRVAALVDINERQWQHSCLRIIEYFTRLWGGWGNVIIPTDGNKIDPLFWKILETFDPDYLEVYQRSGRDFELEEPEKFEEVFQRHILAWESQNGGADEPYASKAIRDNLVSSKLTPFEIAKELQEELKERLAPFYFQEWVVEAGAIGASTIPRHPHTDVLDILNSVEHPRSMLMVENGGTVPPLWWASSFGKANDALEEELAKKGIGIARFGTAAEEVRRLIRLAVMGYEDLNTSAYFEGASAEELHATLNSLPRRLPMIGLGDYRSIHWHDWSEPVVVVAGNSVQDFCFYYSLSRIRSRVVWILPHITDEALRGSEGKVEIDERFHFVNDLANLARGNAQRHAGLKIVSVSLQEDQLDQVRAGLAKIALASTGQWVTARAADVIPSFPIRHYEANDTSVLRSIVLAEEGVIPLFETPLPKNFATVDPRKHRWLTEINIDAYRLPRHYALGEATLGAPYFTSKDVRISADGPTYFCPSNFIFGGASAESSVPRPTIRIPDTLELFRRLAKAGGLSCDVSDKGFYADNACQKFGGLAPLSEFLRSSPGQVLAAAFLDKDKPPAGEHQKGVLINGRRYLDLDSLSAALGDKNAAVILLDTLSLNEVLYRGFVFQCKYCRRADWFPLGEVTDSFKCKRCHRSQVFTQESWRHPSQPNLYYQLDELVYLGLEHNMHVPLLTLDYLRRSSVASFLYVPELKYSQSEGSTCEADLNCVIDGLLTIGEAKKDDRLGKNDKEQLEVISVYLNLGKKLAAHRIVFATASESWHPSTIQATTEASKGQRFQIRLLSQKELYNQI